MARGSHFRHFRSGKSPSIFKLNITLLKLQWFKNRQGKVENILIWVVMKSQRIKMYGKYQKQTLEGNKQFQFSSVAQSCVQLFATPWTAACQASLSITTPGVYSNPCPLSRWCHPTISSSVVPLSSHLQSFPASGSFPMTQLFTSGGQSIGVSALASVRPINIQDWFPLGWAGWLSLLSKGLSRVLSNTTVQKHQFLGVQLSLYSSSHIYTWLLDKP